MPEADPSPDAKPLPRLGSYLLVQALGSGGMSNVFRAIHEESGSVVAVKVLPRTLAKNVTLLQRFIREAKSAEALDHPNIASIYDRGFDQGRHYLVLEYVEGRDLHDRVRINGPLTPEEAVRFIREVAEGLRYAVSQGMIHRDVKPANLLMTPDGHAKIIDLGLALQTVDEDERVTRDGTTVGTVDYMAPEQARDSHQTSERSDIYSLGCTFYYLLTGSPPFPGGGLADKLARHYKGAIPDVRQHRDDVSEGLSLLIRRMMEKKPENRYPDYTKLIAALDSVSMQPDPAVVLDAMIVDDEDDDEIGLAPTESSIGRGRTEAYAKPPSTGDEFLMAEIVDEDDDVDDLPRLPEPTTKRPPAPVETPRSRTRETSIRKEPVIPAEISLAELASLDVDEAAATRRQSRRSSSTTPTFKPPASPNPSRLATAPLDAILDEDDEDFDADNSTSARRSSGKELPLKTWIAAGVLVGLSIAIVGFAVSMLMPSGPGQEVKPPEATENNVDPPGPVEPERPNSPLIGRSGPIRPPLIVKPVEPPRPPSPVKVVVEPPPEEKKYSNDWETRLFPSANLKPATPLERPKILVRRTLEAGDDSQTNSLAFALGRAGDSVEIADTGPFFEDDCQVAGKSRVIRGRGGIRPIIKIDGTTNEIVKEQAAKIVLGGSKIDSLVLEGLDIAVDFRDLPDRQHSLFLCQGADLTLRDCTLTIYNVNDSNRAGRYSIFRVEEGTRPSKIVLERTLVRGPVRTLVDLFASKAEVVFDRSVILGDSGPLIALEPAEKASRSITFHRSLIATRGVVLELSGRSLAPTIRSLGTTFARIDGGSVTSLFSCKGPIAGEPGQAIDWSGEDNVLAGWSSWLSTGPEATSRVNGWEGVRTAWPNSDSSSEESSTPWPATVLRDDINPNDLGLLAPDRRGTLIRVATPHPKLKELTITFLARLPTPELSASMIAPYVAPPPMVIAPPPPAPKAPPKPFNPNATGPNLKVAPKAPTPKLIPPGPLNLVFNVQDAPWQGDLGRFLADKLVAGTPQATIQVRGTGAYLTSPIHLPDGLSIAIQGAAAEGSSTAMVVFVPNPTVVGRSLFELRKGDLAISNLAFTTEGGARPRHWIEVEDSLLAVRHCRFRDPGPQSSTVGASIAFIARGTTPLTPRVGPLVSSTDRPTARLKNTLIWTGGEAILAELGRGVVELDNCLILSNGPAITLNPQPVDRYRFEADLILDRCSIAGDRANIVLGPWQGDPAGPARPWLVSTRRCIFPRPNPAATLALLQVDSDAMARGALFWQSSFDAYEVNRFLTSSGPPPAIIAPADLTKQWSSLWGVHHTRGDLGPNPRRNDPILRYKDRPKTGRITPGSLELDTSIQKDMGVEFKNLPSTPKT